MVQTLAIAVGAGLVSALLFGVLLKASALAIVLYLLSPLPILIVGLGWSRRAALGAAATGAVALAVTIAPFLGLGYAAYIGLPAWWLAYLALLGRPTPEGGLEWYPTGRLLGWIAGTAALAFLAIAVLSSPDHDTFRSRLRSLSGTVVRAQMGDLPARPGTGQMEAGKPDPGKSDPGMSESGTPETGARPEAHADLADALARVVPAFAANGLAVLLAFYLWAAARIVQISGRLPRPWPDIPATQMPRAVLGVAAAATALSLAPGYPGVLGSALLGALAAAFALQGLAAFHDRSRGRSGRRAMLFALYLFLFMTQGFALLVLTLFGIADTALNRRRPGPAPAGGRS